MCVAAETLVAKSRSRIVGGKEGEEEGASALLHIRL